MTKILVIEDEKILAEMYKDKLEKEGFEIILAGDGEEGIKMMKEQRPSLALLDLLMPNENGLELLKKQKEDPEISSIPVIVFSNFDDGETKRLTLSLGAKSYLIKSNHDPKEIVEEIKKYLS
ncbi:MAG: response regulator [Candidatus Paceibacterota bacterium]|jgi:two-component system alkaline phosphatase synthesis response regulator PhoP